MMGTILRIGMIALVLAGAWYFRGGLGDVEGALSEAGWQGVAAITLYHLLPMGLCAFACSTLLPNSRLLTYILARWVRDGVGEIAIFLPLSGEVTSARLLAQHGIRTTLAAAVTIVDITAETLSQFVFTVLGVGVWLWLYPDSQVARWGLIGLGVSLPMLAAFIFLQHSAVMHFLESLPSKLMPKTWQAPDVESGIVANIKALYAQRKRVAVASAGEAWLALRLLGHPLSFAEALALESIIFAIRSAAFVVPSAVGIQEGGYVLVGVALGLPAEVALAVSLLKRAREVVLGVPALFVWHFVEERRASASAAAVVSPSLQEEP